MVKNNKKVLLIVGIIIVLAVFINQKKTGLVCTSNEPTFDTINMEQIKTVVSNAVGSIYNLTIIQGYGEGYPIKSVCVADLNGCVDIFIGMMFSRYSDTISTDIGPGWNITGQEFINQLVALPIGGQFVAPDGGIFIKKEYQGQNYYVLQGVSNEPSGLYFNIQKNLLVLFSPRTQDEIIKSYLDTFYTCQEETPSTATTTKEWYENPVIWVVFGFFIIFMLMMNRR